VILVKSKIQQGSKKTKKIIKEKVNIKSIAMEVSKFKKANDTVILIYDASKDFKTLKDTIRNKWKMILKSRSHCQRNRKRKS